MKKIILLVGSFVAMLGISANAANEIVIDDINDRPQIYEHGDFACLQVTSLAETIKSDAEATFKWQYKAPNTDVWLEGNDNGNLPDNDTHNNIRPTKAGTYRCQVTSGGNTYNSNEITITTKSYTDNYLYNTGATQTTNLPILVIRTGHKENNGDLRLPGWNDDQPGGNNSPAKTKVSADMKLINSGSSNSLSAMDNNAKVYYDGKVRINWRGSTSRSMAKRSLAISMGDKDIKVGGDCDGFQKKKNAMFDGPKEKDWILYSAYQDKSMMRNKLAMDLWKSMGYWAGTGTFVELYIDGRYQGVYVFMDKYEQSENRINVTDEGGYVVKFDKINMSDPGTWYRGDISEIRRLNTDFRKDDRCNQEYGCGSDGGCGDCAASDTKQGWEVVYPDPEDWGANWSSNSEFTSIKNWLTQFDVNLYKAYTGQDGVTYDAVFSEYLDLQSFVDFMILEELARNTDGYRASMYFSKDVNGKLKCVAPWDFEMGFGNTRTHGGTLTNIWQYSYGCNEDGNSLSGGDNEPYYPIPFWWKALMNSDCFKKALKTRWAQLTASGQPLNKDVIWAKVDEMNSQLTNNGAQTNAQTREKERWSWGTRNRVNGIPAYNGEPWIIVPWNDGMSNSCGVSNIHPVPDEKYNPQNFTWSGEGESWDENSGKKTIRWDDEIGLLKAWIYARLDGLGTLINELSIGTEPATDCAQTTQYTFTVKSKKDKTEICESEGVKNIELSLQSMLNGNPAGTYDGTYQWYKNDVAINKATEATYEAKEAGTYKCEVTVQKMEGAPVWQEYQVTSSPITIVECVDESTLVPDDNRTVCISCISDMEFEITPGTGDAIRSIVIEKEGASKPLFSKTYSSSGAVSVKLDSKIEGKFTVTVLTNQYKIIKTYWKE